MRINKKTKNCKKERNEHAIKSLGKTIFLFFLFFLNCHFYFYIDKKDTILSKYVKEQREFCSNLKKFYNQTIEDKLEIVDIRINGLDYKIYTPYKNKKHKYKKFHYFEKKESLNFIAALNYYSQKRSILKKKNIFMLDIGGNIGWYPSLLGRYGYSILTFEPNYENYYVNRKNFCYLNRNSNVVIITKGLNNEEKICDYYRDTSGNTNGMTLCNNNTIKNKVSKRFLKVHTVELTKLSNFIPYLSNKNVALIKIDIEGSEGIVIQDGIDLIS